MQMLPALRQAEHECSEFLQTVSHGLADDRSPRGGEHDRRLLQIRHAAALFGFVSACRRRMQIITLDVFPMVPRPKPPRITVEPRAVHRLDKMNPAALHFG